MLFGHQWLRRCGHGQVASLDRRGDFVAPFTTGRYQVPYWVKSAAQHQHDYPNASAARTRLENVCPPSPPIPLPILALPARAVNMSLQVPLLFLIPHKPRTSDCVPVRVRRPFLYSQA